MKWKDDPITVRLVGLLGEPGVPLSQRITMALLTRIVAGLAIHALHLSPRWAAISGLCGKDKGQIAMVVDPLLQLQDRLLSGCSEEDRKALEGSGEVRGT